MKKNKKFIFVSGVSVGLAIIFAHATDKAERIHAKWIEDQNLYFQTEAFKQGTETKESFLKNLKGDPLIPFSSSYLPFKEGKLYAHREITGAPKLLNKVFLKSSSQKSVVDRYLHLSERIAGVKYNRDAFKTIFDKKDSGKCKDPVTQKLSDCKINEWEGFCNQWTAISSQAEAVELEEKTGGLVCDGVVLSKGEVRELFTALAVDVAGDTFIEEDGTPKGGILVKKETMPNAYRLAYLNMKGYSDLSPKVFDETLFKQLDGNEMIAMDRDPGHEVWNHPIYRAKREFKKINPGYELALFLDKIPPQYLESKNPEVTKLIKEWELKDAELLKSSNQAQFDKNIFADAQRAIFEYGLFGQGGYYNSMQRRADVLIALKNAAHRGILTIKENITITINRNFVQYGLEGAFAEGINHHGVDIFNYGLIFDQSQDKVIDSFWISPEKKTTSIIGGRPDLIWIPQKLADVDTSKTRLGTLMNLLTHYRCTPLKGLLDMELTIKSNAGKTMPELTKNDILRTYKALKPGRVIDEKEFFKLVKESQISNLNIQDFRK